MTIGPVVCSNRLKTLKALYIKAWGKLFATANNATPGLE
jgi:hypothetical protein